MYDKNTLEKILEILQDEHAVLQQIAVLSEKRVEVLMENRFDELAGLDHSEEELVKQLNALEKERLYTGTQMSHEQHPETLTELIACVSPSERQRLTDMQYTLDSVIHRVQFLKSVAESVVQDKQELLDLTLAELSGEKEDTQYNKQGVTRQMNRANSSILIDKSV